MTLVVGMVDADGVSADETLFRLALTDLAPALVDRWWNAGARDPSFVRAATSNHMSTAEAGRYLSAQVTTGADLDKHRRAYITGDLAVVLHRAGHTTPVDQRRYIRTGPHTANTLIPYATLGVEDLAFIERCVDTKISAEDAAGFWLAGFDADDIDTIKTLLGKRISGDDALAFTEAGVLDPDLMVSMHTSGLNGTAVTAYRRLGFDLAEMRRLHEAFVSPDRVEGYREAGIETVDDIETLCSGRASQWVDPDDAGRYRDAGATTAADMRRLADAGVSSAVAVEFAEVGVTDLDDMIRYTDVRLFGSDISAFRSMGIERIDDMLDLEEAGIRDYEARWYVNGGVDDIATMKALHAGGVDGTMAAAYRRAGVPVELMSTLAGLRVRGNTAEHFARLGFSGDDMVTFAEAQVSLSEVDLWVRAGVTTVAEILDLERQGADASRHLRSVRRGSNRDARVDWKQRR